MTVEVLDWLLSLPATYPVQLIFCIYKIEWAWLVQKADSRRKEKWWFQRNAEITRRKRNERPTQRAPLSFWEAKGNYSGAGIPQFTKNFWFLVTWLSWAWEYFLSSRVSEECRGCRCQSAQRSCQRSQWNWWEDREALSWGIESRNSVSRLVCAISYWVEPLSWAFTWQRGTELWLKLKLAQILEKRSFLGFWGRPRRRKRRGSVYHFRYILKLIIK